MKRIVVFALILNAALLGVIAQQFIALAGDDGPLATRQNGDVNGDQILDMSDAVYLLIHLFNGGAEPVALADSPELLARVDDHAGEIAEMRAEIADLAANQLQLIRHPALHTRRFGGARFFDADLRGADFRGAELGGAWLMGADLTGANLRGADLRATDMTNANITGADLRGVYYGDELFNGPIGIPAFMPDDSACDLAGPGAFLFGQMMNLRDCDLHDADLAGANLEGADLRGADLRGASLRGANLVNANLRGANVQDADLRGAIGADWATHAPFEGAIGTPAFMHDDPLPE